MNYEATNHLTPYTVILLGMQKKKNTRMNNQYCYSL